MNLLDRHQPERYDGRDGHPRRTGSSTSCTRRVIELENGKVVRDEAAGSYGFQHLDNEQEG